MRKALNESLESINAMEEFLNQLYERGYYAIKWGITHTRKGYEVFDDYGVIEYHAMTETDYHLYMQRIYDDLSSYEVFDMDYWEFIYEDEQQENPFALRIESFYFDNIVDQVA